MSFTVCQSQPSSLATSFTLRAWRPTWSVAHRAARVVRSWRGAAIRSSSSVHEPIGQSASGHIHRRLCHTSGGTAEQRQVDELDPGPVLHPGDDAARRAAHRSGHRLDVDLATPAGPSSTPRKRDVGKSDHPDQRARRVSLHGGPPSSVVEQPQTGGPPLHARGSSTIGPRSNPKCR